MVIGVDMGHPFNCGAFGFMSETDGNRAVGKLLIRYLQDLGHKVVNCTYEGKVKELENRVRLANAHKLDLFISLHMDSYHDKNANGVTSYTTGNSGAKATAKKIVDEVAKSCGYYNRGLKHANFYVLKNTLCPAVLLEMGFVSNEGDTAKFDADKIAKAIVKAVTGSVVDSKSQGYVVTNYLPHGYRGNGEFEGVDMEYVLSYFEGVRTFVRANSKGIWIETQNLPIEKCYELKEVLGSWFYEIK